MQDIDRSQITDKLFHFEDKTVREIKERWFRQTDSGNVDVATLIGKCRDWFLGSRRNKVVNVDDFAYTDFTYGCTDYIDNFLAKQKDFQILEKEYSYYSLLGIKPTPINELRENIPVIVSLPNYFYGNSRPDWSLLLDVCQNKNIDIHIDAAWYTATKDFNLDVSHPSIKTIALSITKTGFEWNKFGIRLSRKKTIDSITIRNHNKSWINQNTLNCANYILDNIEVDHAWDSHETAYNLVCEKFNLEKTPFIHVAKQNGKPVGVAQVLRKITQ